VDFILQEFEKKLSGYAVQTFDIDAYEKVLLVEDSLALYVGKVLSDFPVCANADTQYAWTAGTAYMDMPVTGADYYHLMIEELTYNTLGFKYNHSKLIREMEAITKINHLGLDVTYTKFKGYTRLYWCPEAETLAEEIDRRAPELRLRERYEAWEGICYYFIVLELEAADGSTEYAVAYTNQKPYSYITNKGREWIEKGFERGDMRGSYPGLDKAFASWKKTSRQYRLENHLKYFFFEKHFREKDEVWRYADEILEQARSNAYPEIERGTYLRPLNKWTTEELVYEHIKKLYKQYNVIYQHRPFFLTSPIGGRMSYDVFIAGLNVAVEYQGKQHFEPVEFFGGEEAFRKTVERDKLKKELSEDHGVRLVYINHWENITPELIRERVNVAASG